MKKLRILSLAPILFISAGVMAVDIINFEKDFSVCISPGYSCSGNGSVYDVKGGSLDVYFRWEGYDEDSYTVDYKIDIKNYSDCKIQISNIKLKHGSREKFIDWGLIELEANESLTSRKQTVYMSEDAARKYEHMRLKFSGLAHCPD